MIRIKNEDCVFEFTFIFRYWFTKKQYCQICGLELYPLSLKEYTYKCMNPKCQNVTLTIVRIDP